jgi:Smg protein
MFDVLVYLYENYGAFNACSDADAVSRRLVAAGFDEEEISAALGWLQGLVRVSRAGENAHLESDGAFRVYSGAEAERLGAQAAGFLHFLESAGQISPAQREIVVERALAIEEAPVSLDKLKVIVLIVLWSQQADIDILLLEELLDDGEDRLLH